MEQIDKAPTNNPPDVSKKKSPGKRGRPQGSKNRSRRAVELSPALRFVQETITRFLQLIGDHVKVIYFVYDGAFGNNDALQMVKQTGLHLISKLRHDSALYQTMAEDHARKSVGECHPYREFEGMQSSI